MKLSSIAAVLSSAAILTAACAKVQTGQVVLQGSIEGDPVEVIIVSYLPGQLVDYHYPEVNDGQFEFTMDGVEGFGDFIVSVGGCEFGARINALDTLKMGFVVNEYAKDVEVRYDGANEKESRIWADFYETYLHYSVYNLPETDPDITPDMSIAKLDRNDSTFRATYKADMNKYYRHRADIAYGLMKAILLDLKAYNDGEESYDYPEYAALLDRVDPNDPDEVTFPLVNRWAGFHMREFGDEPIAATTSFLKQYGAKITNPTIREMLTMTLVSSCMDEIKTDSLDIYEPLFAEVDKLVPDRPEIVEGCRAQIVAALSSQPGKPVPDADLLTPDGKEVLLSSLFGKILYVDVWATWCGPCVAEAPYFKALAEKYKDDARICFVSISVDRDSDAWKAFVSKEKPFWPQYIFTDASHGDFCDKVGIKYIPRFMLIGPDGTFINGDCARPSSEEIDTILSQALAGM